MIERPTPGRSRWWLRPSFPVAAFVLLRLVVVAAADVPAIVPDEPGSWAVARWLSGVDPPILMNDMPVYPLVPGAVLAPLHWLPLGPVARYRLGLVVASALVLAAGFLVRRTVQIVTADPLAGTVALTMTLLYGATMVTTSFTWSEPAVLLCWAVLAWSVVSCSTARVVRPLALFGGSVAAALAPFVHARMTAVPLVWLALLFCLLPRWRAGAGPVPARRLGGAAAVTIVVGAMAAGVHRWMVSEIWSDPRSNSLLVRDVIADPSSWVDVATSALGQLWYATVSSAGLAVVGVAAITAVCVQPRRRGDRTAALALTAMFASTAAASALFMASTVGRVGADRAGELTDVRWDHVAYGRYIDVVVLLLGIAGITALLRSDPVVAWRRLGAAGGLAVLTASMFILRWHGTALAAPVDANTGGIAVLGERMGPGALIVATAMSLTIMFLLVLAVREGRTVVASVTVALLLVGSVSGALVAIHVHRMHSYAPMFQDVPAAVAGSNVAVVPSDARVDRAMVLNWYGQQYVLAGSDWRFRFVDAASGDVARDLGAEIGLVALTDGSAPPGFDDHWRAVGGGGDVTLWLRR